MKTIADPIVDVRKEFNLHLADFDGCYPNAPPARLALGGKVKTLHIKVGEQRLGTYVKPVIWGVAQLKPGALAALAPTLDHELPEDFRNFDSLSPTDKAALIAARSAEYGGIGCFLGYITCAVAEHSWVKQHIGPPLSAAELRRRADAEQVRIDALRAEAIEREQVEAENPGLADWRALGESGALSTFPQQQPAPSAPAVLTADQVNSTAPNTQSRMGNASGVNVRTGAFAPGSHGSVKTVKFS